MTFFAMLCGYQGSDPHLRTQVNYNLLVFALQQNPKDCKGKEQFESFDLVSFTKATFGMFSGKEEKVEMVFHNSLIDTVIDKFGKDVFISVVDDHHFKITVPVAVSPQFFAWIFGLGGKVTILGPKSVVKQMKDMLAKVSERYSE